MSLYKILDKHTIVYVLLEMNFSSYLTSQVSPLV